MSSDLRSMDELDEVLAADDYGDFGLPEEPALSDLESFDYAGSKALKPITISDFEAFLIYKGAHTNKFVIEITGDTRWIKERQWADDQQIQKTKTGIKLSFTSNQFEKVLEWTLSQGSYARPLAPKMFVELWNSIVADMAKIARS